MGTRRRLTKEDVEAAAPGWLWDQDAPALAGRKLKLLLTRWYGMPILVP